MVPQELWQRRQTLSLAISLDCLYPIIHWHPGITIPLGDGDGDGTTNDDAD